MWPMTKGLLETLGMEPVGAPDDDALRAEAAAWLRSRAATANVADEKSTRRGGEPLFVPTTDWPTPAPGTAVAYRPFANGSNTDRGRFLETPPATTSGWKASPDLPFDPTIDVPKFKLVDGKLVRDDQPPLDPWTLLPPEAKMGREQVE
jgi:hypothetical protein